MYSVLCIASITSVAVYAIIVIQIEFVIHSEGFYRDTDIAILSVCLSVCHVPVSIETT